MYRRHSFLTFALSISSLMWPAFAQGAKTSSTPKMEKAEAKRPPTADETVVFEALDLTRPELAVVAAAVQAKDYDAATRAWADYLRNRKGFYWGGKDAPAPKKYNEEVAANAAIGKVAGGYVPLVHAFPDGKIDWKFNATEHTPGATPNAEWLFQLNRMMFWPEMSRAYTVTGDDRFTKAFASQLHSWVAANPAPATAQNQVGSTWRTIETGIRMGHTWPAAFFAFLNSPALTDADIMAYTRSTFEQGDYLRKHHTGVNWLLMEMNGLATAGSFFPEFRDSADWRFYAFNKLNDAMKEQLLPDGGQIELSSGYMPDVVIPNFLGAQNVAMWTGHEKELPEGYENRLEKAFTWVMDLSTPDRDRPKFNDSWPGKVRIALKPATALFPARDDFKWFASEGAEGAAPKETSLFLDWSGFAVMRSGWQEDANYLVFDVGPLGFGGHMGIGHSHQDKLNVVVWAHGREILFDNGGSSYRWDKWRVWSRSSLSHNCVLVDGLGQNRGEHRKEDGADFTKDPTYIAQEPIRAAWQTSRTFDFASATYDQEFGTSEWTGKGNYVPGVYDNAGGPQKRRIAEHRRSVLFLKPDIYLVADTLTPYDDQEHSYQARWQLKSTEILEGAKTHILTTNDPGLPNLSVIPLLPEGLEVKYASAQEKPEILGWNCRKDETPERLPSTTVMHTKSGVGVQHIFTALLPLAAGEDSLVTGVSKFGSRTTIQFADGRRLLCSITEKGGIKVSETLADGKAGRTAGANP